MPPSPCFEFLRAATLIILLVLEYRVSSWQAVRDAQGLHAWSSAALQPNLSPVRTEAVLSAPVCCFFWCLHTLSILISFKSILNIYLISLYRANRAEKHRQNSDALFLKWKNRKEEEGSLVSNRTLESHWYSHDFCTQKYTGEKYTGEKSVL